MKSVWILLLGIAPLYLLRDFVRQMLFAQLNLRLALALDVLVAAVQLGLMLPLAMAGTLNVELTWLSIALASGLAALFWALGKQETFRGSISAARQHARENWTFAKWALLTPEQLLARADSNNPLAWGEPFFYQNFSNKHDVLHRFLTIQISFLQ